MTLDDIISELQQTIMFFNGEASDAELKLRRLIGDLIANYDPDFELEEL